MAAATVLAGALVLAPAPALAGDLGTHFLLQLQAGVATAPLDSLGLAFGYGAQIGFGGRLLGTPLRFYGLLSFDRADYSGDGCHPQTGVRWSSERAFTDLQAGLRLLVPIVLDLRWYLDVVAGAGYVQGELSLADREPLSLDRWAAVVTIATGLEYRWHRHFATGVRVDTRWTSVEGDALGAAIGDGGSPSWRFVFLATQSVLF